MFGQPAASPFGAAPASTPFGAAPTPAFGSPAPAPAFGAAPASTPFGAAPASGGFGAPAPAFGSPAPAPAFGAAPASTPFGAAPSTGFGAAAPAPAFGASTGGFGAAPATSAFGSSTTSTPFGAPAPAPSGGLFGAPAPAPTGGLFGAPAPAPTGGLFGAPAPAPATGGLFGAPAPAPSGGLFAAPAPSAFGGGGFGSPAAAQGGGTKLNPFQPTRKQDGTSSIQFQSITAMPQYQTKSFEELRVEDYMAGNKGSQGQAPATGGFGAPAAGGFGSPAPAPGGFGGFGSPAPAPAPFGAPTSGFGAAPAPATGGLFGSTPAPAFGATSPAPAPAGGLFGAPAPAPTGGLFGGAAPAPATGGLFGSTPAPAPATGGLFGSTPAPAPAFGGFGASPAPAPATGGLFGAPATAPATGGLFGSTPAPAPATGGLFGSTPAPAAGGGLFGSTPAPASGGLFGAAPAPVAGGGLFGSTPAPAPATGGLFGSTPAPATGGGFFGSTPAPAIGGGLFGSTPAPATGGLFGSTPAPATGGLFGSTPAPATGGLFGSTPAPATGGLFGSTPAPATTIAPATQQPAGTTILVPPAAETILAQQMAAIENQNKELAVLEAWRGGNTKSPNKMNGVNGKGSIIPTSVFQRDAQAIRYRGLAGGTSNGVNQINGSTSTMLSAYQAAPRSAAKIRPRGFTPAKTTIGSASRSARGMLSPTSFLGSATKQLVIKPDALTPKPKTRLILSDEEVSEKQINGGTNSASNDTPNDLIKGRNISKNNDRDDNPASKSNRELPFESPKPGFVSPAVPSRATSTSKPSSPPLSAQKTPTDQSYDFYKSVIGSPVPATNVNDSAKKTSSVEDVSDLIPKLTKEGYVMKPSAEELSQMSAADLAAVPNFVIERIGYGSVAWDGAVDVRGIDLDSVVSIEKKAVEVYHQEEESGNKPPVGTKLNRPAIITLHEVYPKSGSDATEAEKIKFEKKIEKNTSAMGASLVLYDVDFGIWKLHVEHFSRYALDDDSDDEEVEVLETIPPTTEIAEHSEDFESGVRGGRTQDISWGHQLGVAAGGLTRFQAPDEDEDDAMDVENNLLLTSKTDEPKDAAYQKLIEIDEQMQLEYDVREESKSMYMDEGHNDGSFDIRENEIFPPVTISKPKFSISAKIAQRCNVTRPTSAANDFGMRMGRSFGVCWTPDGSFLHPSKSAIPGRMSNTTLKKSKPVVSTASTLEKLLSTHLKHKHCIDDSSSCPTFVLRVDNDIVLEDFDAAAKVHHSEFFGEASHAFELISILFGQLENDDPFTSQRRRELAFENWLRGICAASMEKDIQKACAVGDYYGAIFVALSCGDEKKAAEIARSRGFHMLALFLANGDAADRNSLKEQMQQWNNKGAVAYIPDNLLRIYCILVNDLELENALFSKKGQLPWQRRLMMTFQAQKMHCNASAIVSTITQYEEDFASNVAPRPLLENGSTSVLFRILKAYKSSESDEKLESLLQVVSPNGHSTCSVENSMTFHLSSILSPLGFCLELSEEEEASILDSFASQLEQDGYWKLAVYVSLCRLRSNRDYSSVVLHKMKTKAQEIIYRNYVDENNHQMKNDRHFLETDLNIPTIWFEKALCLAAVKKMDANSLIRHSSPLDGLKIYEEALLPDICFDLSRNNCEGVSTFLTELGVETNRSSSLSEVILDYLDLKIKIDTFMKSSTERSNMQESFEELLKKADFINKGFLELSKKTSPPETLPGYSNVTKSTIIVEIMNSISRLVSKLHSYIKGESKRVGDSGTTLSHFSLSFCNKDFNFNQMDSRMALREKFPFTKNTIVDDAVYRPRKI